MDRRPFLEKKFTGFFALIAVVAIMGFSLIFKATEFRRFFNEYYSKLQNIISYPAEKISDLKEEYGDHINTAEKLKQLKVENEKIAHKLNDQSFIENQNKELKKILKFSQKLPKFVLTTRIISSSIDSYIGRILILSGSQEGVRKGMAVINDVGVVGRVIDVGENFSEVLLITDSNSRIVGYNPKTNDKMIISGIGENSLRANFVEDDSKMNAGDIIYTTGEGGYFPEGLPIGKIVSLDHNDIILSSMFNIQKTHYVQVIGNQISLQG